MSSEYPALVDGAPPTITLKEYDVAPWAGTTCVDLRPDGYVVVVMQTPDQVVAKIDSKDNEVLDRIFKSAHQNYANQQK